MIVEAHVVFDKSYVLSRTALPRVAGLVPSLLKKIFHLVDDIVIHIKHQLIYDWRIS